ncbi:hypothetical protein AMTR_s00080p00172520 [Amborella trichopoda]|uniref:Uncharacterized protein n=1 Tax=Amborella trichopoda TaxID=13333 RepID=W1PD46_AMBTC|nr:hypothetical protein AMTR_s00080p00172520 [Amborella trichopoda]
MVQQQTLDAPQIPKITPIEQWSSINFTEANLGCTSNPDDCPNRAVLQQQWGNSERERLREGSSNGAAKREIE